MNSNNLSIITLNQEHITDFAAARNSELAKAKTEWVLFIDTDEKITEELKAEILTTINDPSSSVYSAYYIPRLDTFLGRVLRHGETGDAKFIRLSRRDFGTWQRPVHEVWMGSGRVGNLHSPILHRPHDSISSFLEKINSYSSIEAKYRFEQGIKSSLWKIVIYPLAKFKWNYFFKLGFLDGTPGAIMAIMMSFHSYLTWTKLYLLWHKK